MSLTITTWIKDKKLKNKKHVSFRGDCNRYVDVVFGFDLRTLQILFPLLYFGGAVREYAERIGIFEQDAAELRDDDDRNGGGYGSQVHSIVS